MELFFFDFVFKHFSVSNQIQELKQREFWKKNI